MGVKERREREKQELRTGILTAAREIAREEGWGAVTIRKVAESIAEQRLLWNLRRADGYCVHNQPDTHHCGVYQDRPIPCRIFDCRKDKRIWSDFDQRIPAPAQEEDLVILARRPSDAEVAEKARARHNAMQIEDAALRFKRT